MSRAKASATALFCGCVLSACVVNVSRPAGSQNYSDAYYAVLGFGLIRFPVPGEGVHFERTTSVGFSITNSPAFRVNLGLARSMNTAVSTRGRPVRVEVQAPHFAPTRVRIEPALSCTHELQPEDET